MIAIQQANEGVDMDERFENKASNFDLPWLDAGSGSAPFQTANFVPHS